ncbi:hypothetical protein F4813DRAFT_3968 [Daldinia decipiens]|uniref:uncharacterized protein n=1 Tax=Daldinia decipiens TaxID=326647 RepID=UPI0020C1CDF2|nr:uncharacterized protein F4813DRAFT_3968 [Daldinia decipiens]KAI1662609.1 hypothetical protein F4813DRAFT_3968 [Daldinia decipiens]
MFTECLKNKQGGIVKDRYHLTACSRRNANSSISSYCVFRHSHFQPTSTNFNLLLTLHYTTLHYTTLHYTTLHYTTLHYTTLHYTTHIES